MTEVEARVSQHRRISPVWFIPILAVLLGAWMVFYTWQNEGPTIEIVFNTAQGIEAGKTKIRSRSVQIGLVEHVELSEDFEHVIVSAKMERFAMPLLREDSRLWVVTAKIGSGGVTGLGTLLSGGYIELEPGAGAEGQRSYVALEQAPVTADGTPGIHFTLFNREMGSVDAGDPILYKGFKVGRIESKTPDLDAKLMRYTGFVEVPYDKLVTEAIQFWDVSGISLSASADGIEFQTTSLEAMLIGGVAFGLPDGMKPGAKLESGANFEIHPDRQSINEKPYRQFVEYVVLFDRSVRGLLPGAPVEFRGLHSGEVVRVMLKEMIAERDTEAERTGTIAVLIRLQPATLGMGDSPESVEIFKDMLEGAIGKGLRATLATGNIVTGNLLVSLDYYDDAEPASIGTFADRPTIPAVASGLQSLEIKMAALLDKLNALPLEKVINTANTTLGSADTAFVDLQDTIAELNAILANEDLQALPQSVQRTLAELDRTLEAFGGLAGTLEAEPSSIIFSRQYEADPEPPAGAP